MSDEPKQRGPHDVGMPVPTCPVCGGYHTEQQCALVKSAKSIMPEKTKKTIRPDAVEIVRRLKQRNPALLEAIAENHISLEQFAEACIFMWCEFNCVEVTLMAEETAPDLTPEEAAQEFTNRLIASQIGKGNFEIAGRLAEASEHPIKTVDIVKHLKME